jgi:hypothetical protein
MFENISCVNPTTIIISIIAMIFLIIFKIVNKLVIPKIKVPVKIYLRDQKKWVTKMFPWPFPIPAQLIVVSLKISLV